MIVTINTDASFSRKHEVGSYAFWIVCDEFKILKSGMLRKRVSRPEIAEFRCIINAFHCLFKEKTDKKITKIIVNTDCLNVIHLINGDKQLIKRYNLGGWGDHLVLKLNLLKTEYKHGQTLTEFRHVKSHNDTSTKKGWVNEWCDVEAKKHIKDYIDKNNWKFKKVK